MKRRELIRQLERAGCKLVRHGARHDIYRNPATGQQQLGLTVQAWEVRAPDDFEKAVGREQQNTETNPMKKIVSLAVVAMLLALSVPAHAQQPTKVPRIGYFSGSGDPRAWPIEIDSDPGSFSRGLRQGLRDLGYIEGKNILFEYRGAGGNRDRIPGLVAELLQLKVDVFVSGNHEAIRAAKEATKTVPIVMVYNLDPVADGIVDSLAHPGGNITGLTTLGQDLSGKRLELLTEVVPGIARVGLLGDANADWVIVFKEYEAAARALKIPLQSLEVRGPNPDVEGAFQAAAKGGASALIAHRSLLRYAKQIADLAIKNQLPSMYEESRFVEVGGLVSYTSNDAENYRRAAVYVDKILKGAKPADLPVEEPTKFELVINLKTAEQLGLTIPPSVLYRADRVIK